MLLCENETKYSPLLSLHLPVLINEMILYVIKEKKENNIFCTKSWLKNALHETVVSRWESFTLMYCSMLLENKEKKTLNKNFCPWWRRRNLLNFPKPDDVEGSFFLNPYDRKISVF
jgi:hypothetical protein